MLFYDNFERICRMRGTTPSGAVVAIGKNKTTAGNWKRNNTIPSEDILEKLARQLDCSIADFFLSEEDMAKLEGRVFLESFIAAHGDEKIDRDDVVKGRSLLHVLKAGAEAEETDSDDGAEEDADLRGESSNNADLDTFLEIYRRCTRSQRYELMSIICKFEEENLR